MDGNHIKENILNQYLWMIYMDMCCRMLVQRIVDMQLLQEVPHSKSQFHDAGLLTFSIEVVRLGSAMFIFESSKVRAWCKYWTSSN